MKSIIIATLFLFSVVLKAQTYYTSAESFKDSDPIVSTTFFHWFASTGGQLSGPWMPIEGRENWTGLPPWWKTQIKQVMMANIDVINVHLINSTEIRRELLFQAIAELRAEGYDVPKIAPFLDPLITWFNQPKIDLATAAGKDSIANQYIRFYQQYFDRNTDDFAGDYLAKIDENLILDTWHLFLNFDNVASLTKADLNSRLTAAFPNRPEFNQSIYMITPALNDPTFSFTDERTPKFEINEYFVSNTFNNRKTAQIKAGYWDQNIRMPGDFLPRDGGIHYDSAWQKVDQSFKRIYIESWNEYDEGTGIYAGSIDEPHLINGNPNTDVYSTSNNPYEYINTTAKYAALFNKHPDLASQMLEINFPDTITFGTEETASVLIRNMGDFSWTDADGFEFKQLANDAIVLSATGGTLNDNENEIPVYGGIFKGRPIRFNLKLSSPDESGLITTHWQMMKDVVPFGEIIEADIFLKNVSTSTKDIFQTEIFPVSFYPNPSKNTWKMEISSVNSNFAEITIYDQVGKIIDSQKSLFSGDQFGKNLLPGLYVIRVKFENEIVYRQLIKT